MDPLEEAGHKARLVLTAHIILETGAVPLEEEATGEVEEVGEVLIVATEGVPVAMIKAIWESTATSSLGHRKIPTIRTAAMALVCLTTTVVLNLQAVTVRITATMKVRFELSRRNFKKHIGSSRLRFQFCARNHLANSLNNKCLELSVSSEHLGVSYAATEGIP